MEDWFGWLTKMETVRAVIPLIYFIDFTQPEVQDIIVQQAISVASVGYMTASSSTRGLMRALCLWILVWQSGNANTIERKR